MDFILKKPHALCIPTPFQGHINPMLKLAKILHSRGFHITFVNTEFYHQRLLRSQGSDALNGLPSFCFEAIPDGLPPPENPGATPDALSFCMSVDEICLGPLKSLLSKLNASSPPVTCMVADIFMGFTHDAAREFDIPEIVLWTSDVGSLMCLHEYPNLLERDLVPRKDSTFLSNEYLNTMIDCIPTMPGLRLKDLPSFTRRTSPADEYMLQYLRLQTERAKSASAIIFNTFHELDSDLLDTLSSVFAPCYAVGPFHLLEKEIDESLPFVKSSLWKEDNNCLKWLESKPPSSVIYVNFGSITVMKYQHLLEFCWGLANSNYPFLWIIRPDLVIGQSAVQLPSEFFEETSSRGMLASWCPQEQVLNHPSIGGFLTHSGWNSTIECISSGVPMICCPFSGDQQTNCWSCCNRWGVGMEIEKDVKREEVAKLVIELMNGEKGKEMRKNATDLKNMAEKACSSPFGSSTVNLEKVIQLLQATPNNSLSV
ncbi:unnamed protein product [Lactuca virosa]|uniref:Glycosyltransferase N-terminal domain-containing protein n=1 Tax=Lactuca virosa TaxID=75947 RepID=A0AAU9PVL2_9ASTR|nr:unnamed protein product [Lactuca virosa]